MTRIIRRIVGKGLTERKQAYLILEADEKSGRPTSDTPAYRAKQQSEAHKTWANAGHVLKRCEMRLLQLDKEVIARPTGPDDQIADAAKDVAKGSEVGASIDDDRDTDPFSEGNYLRRILACKTSAEIEMSSGRFNYALRDAVMLGELLGEMKIVLPHNEKFIWGAARWENTAAGAKSRRSAPAEERHRIVAQLFEESRNLEHAYRTAAKRYPDKGSVRSFKRDYLSVRKKLGQPIDGPDIG